MQLAKRHEIGIEILQAGAFALLVGFIYHYFGPSAATSPSPEVFAALTCGVVLLVATAKQRPRVGVAQKTASETLTCKQTTELTEKLRLAAWDQLEGVVADIYGKLGCPVSRRTTTEGESNFSLIIERAGQKTAVMCKPWKDSEVTSPDIIEFSTEMRQAGISRGTFVTLRDCTAPAMKVAETLGVDIVDEEALLQLVAATGPEFRTRLLATLADGRKFCPTCDHEMVLRTATTGLGAGEQFWGCSEYPQCRCTVPH